MLTNEKENFFYQFLVGYLLNTELNINKTFKEQVASNQANYFSST